jgi:hypothetical protein
VSSAVNPPGRRRHAMVWQARGCVGQEDRDLAVLDPSGGARVLTLDPDAGGALSSRPSRRPQAPRPGRPGDRARRSARRPARRPRPTPPDQAGAATGAGSQARHARRSSSSSSAVLGRRYRMGIATVPPTQVAPLTASLPGHATRRPPRAAGARPVRRARPWRDPRTHFPCPGHRVRARSSCPPRTG